MNAYASAALRRIKYAWNEIITECYRFFMENGIKRLPVVAKIVVIHT